MQQKLTAALQTLYSTRKDAPHLIRMMMQMSDPIDRAVLRSAVDVTMQRYPYFCVELRKNDGQYVFEHNTRPVVISDTLGGTELNSESSNYHMIAFSAENDWIVLDVFHGLTDGIGAYEVIRTLLYYYCSEKYSVQLSREGIRLAGDQISAEEWEDPTSSLSRQPDAMQPQMLPALVLTGYPGLLNDHKKTVHSIALSEAEFMSFNSEHKGSPGTMTALLLSRAVAKLHPEAAAPIRIIVCVNQRKALRAPLAHQSLVGFSALEYDRQLRGLPIGQQVTEFRRRVHEQSGDEAMLSSLGSAVSLAAALADMKTDEQRLDAMNAADAMLNRNMTAVISYVGKAGFGDAEKYIRDFRTWTRCPDNGIIVEIAAVNGRFIMDIIQPFSDPVYVNGFLQQLKENGVAYEHLGIRELTLPNIKLPWSE